MRALSIEQEIIRLQRTSAPIHVVRIIFGQSSPSISSITGLTNLPGSEIQGALQSISAASQQIWPEDGRSTMGALTVKIVDHVDQDQIAEVAFAFPFLSDEDTIGRAAGSFITNGVEVGMYARDDLTGVYYKISAVFADTIDMIGDPNPVVWDSRAYTIWSAAPFPVTEEFRDQLENNNEGLRDKEVQVYQGESQDFNDFELVNTYFIDSVSFLDGVYTIKCRDKTKGLRKKIFEPKTVLINDSLDVTETTISAQSSPATAGFQTMETHSAWTEGPSGTYGWIKIVETGEIIRYTGISGNDFTGCTRGAFKTTPTAIDLDADDPATIEEFIYFEGPAVWALAMIMHGVIDAGVSPRTMVPDHWHLGMSLDDDFDIDSFLDIGIDLWDVNSFTGGFGVRGTYLKGVDGKRFIEKEILQLIGCYMVSTASGQLRLKRINRVIGAVPAQAVLNEDNVISVGPLQHQQQQVSNTLHIDWNHDGEKFTRRLVVIDSTSIAKHGASNEKRLPFRLLYSKKHTAQIIRNRMDVYRDRYSEPPIRLRVQAAPNMNHLEVGDVVLVELPNVQNYQDDGAAGHLKLNFEIQKAQIDWTNGGVTFDLFASSRLLGINLRNETSAAPIADTWYTQSGGNETDIAGLGGYAGGVLTGGTFTGSANMANTAAVYYHDGNLTIEGTVTLQHNVQLRIKGFLTINGTLNGVGEGKDGNQENQIKGNTPGALTRPGTAGYLGPTLSGESLATIVFIPVSATRIVTPAPGGRVEGAFTSAPLLNIDVDDSGFLMPSLFPEDIRGTSGSTGANMVDEPTWGSYGTTGTIRGVGGTGGDSGAGLLIVCRGLGWGASGVIDLSGTDGLPGETSIVDWDIFTGFLTGGSMNNYTIRSGSGAGGCPGAMHVLLDGDAVLYPSIDGTKFVANKGASPLAAGVVAYDRPSAGYQTVFGLVDTGRFGVMWDGLPEDGSAVSPNVVLGGDNSQNNSAPVEMWREAHFIQHIHDGNEAVEKVLQPPTSLAATTTEVGVIVLGFDKTVGPEVDVEIFRSDDNDRANSEEVYQGPGILYYDSRNEGGTFYYWVRHKDRSTNEISTWFPVSATGGTVGTALPNIGHTTAEQLLASEWRYTFEDAIWDNNPPIAASSSTLAKDADSYSGIQAALTTATAGNVNRTMTLQVPESIAVSMVNRRLRLSWWYKMPASNPSNEIRVQLRDNTNADIIISELGDGGDFPRPTSSWQYAEAFSDILQQTCLDLEVRISADVDGTNDAILIDDVSLRVVPELFTDQNIEDWVLDEAVVLERDAHTAASGVLPIPANPGIVAQTVDYDLPHLNWVGKVTEVEFTGWMDSSSAGSHAYYRIRRFHDNVFNLQITDANGNVSWADSSGIFVAVTIVDTVPNVAVGVEIEYRFEMVSNNNPDVTIEDRNMRLRVLNK